MQFSSGKKRLRIAFFTETFLPKVDGIVTTLSHLLDYLSVHDHEALVFAPEGGPETYAGAPVIGLPHIPFPFYLELKLVPPIFNVQRDLLKFRPDVVHVLFPTALGLSGLRQARRLALPVVASFHTDIPGFMAEWGFEWLSAPTWAVLRKIHNAADLNLCPSVTTRKMLYSKGFHRLKVWSRGVDTHRFHPHHHSPAWRQRLTAGHPEAPLLLYVGRLSPEKRVDWLHPLLAALPDIRLVVVGDGPARPKLETLVLNSVKITGQQTSSLMPPA